MRTVVELGSVADVNWGDTSVTKSSYVEEGLPAFSASGHDGFLPYADFNRDGIVLSAIGAQCGKTWFATGQWSCIKNTIRFWSEDETRLNNRYLYWLTAEQSFWPRRGAAQPFITIGDARKLKIAIPGLDEQRRIAAILDQADDLRRKRREALERLEALRSATFEATFGDPVQNEMGWPRQIFGSIINEIGSGWSPVCLDRPAAENEWGVLKLSAVTRCEYDDAEQKGLPPEEAPRPNIEVKAGDILFTRKNTRDLVAACALVTRTRPKLMLSDLIFRIRMRENAPADPIYIHGLLTRPSKRRAIQSLAGGSAGSMPNISKEKLRAVEIELPPLDLQRAFAARVAAIDALKAQHRAHLAKLDALFASLQHRAFRGEL